jgi:hypothetical protein
MQIRIMPGIKNTLRRAALHFLKTAMICKIFAQGIKFQNLFYQQKTAFKVDSCTGWRIIFYEPFHQQKNRLAGHVFCART